MSDRDFEIGSHKFKLNKMDAFKQFHIVRRIGPILADMLPAMAGLQKVNLKEGLSETEKLENFAEIAAPIMKGLSKLSDADADKVLYGLLSCVEVQQESGNWAKVSTDTMILINSFDLPVLLQIAGRAFGYNLSGFFAALPRK